MKYQKSISIVLAAYNEDNLVESAVKEIIEVLENSFNDYEVILIDDGSTDCTRERMERCSSAYTNVLVLENYVNLNFGTSVLRGLYSASKDCVMFNAVDLPLAPADIPKVFNDIDDCDMVVLQRTGYKTTLWRRITSQINVLMLNILFPHLIKGTPILNFIQIFKRNRLQEIKPLARSPIFVWPELIFRAKLAGFKWKNILVKCAVEEVRGGAFGKPHDIIWGIYEMLRFRGRLWKRNI